jgi:DNA-binding sugar fermentation-stimulating protein
MHVDTIEGISSSPDEITKCYCPSTGSIANLNFERASHGIPCLLSKNLSKKAKTEYTVEALSLFETNYITQVPSSSWIGINQVC